MRTALTDTFLRSPKRRPLEEHYDANGLVIRIGKKQSKWMIRTRPPGSKTYTRKPIGYFPAMSLAEARAIAAEHAHRRLYDIPEGDVNVRVPGTVLTLEDLLNRYERARKHERLKSFEASMKILRRGFAEHAKLDMRAFTRQDMRAAHSAMADGGRLVNGNRFLAYASVMFNWAIDEELIEINWARGKGGAVKRAKEKPRERVLTMDELAAIWRATYRYVEGGSDQGRATRRAYASLVRFLMLTGQRLSEAINLRYGHIVAGQWTQTENKASRVHRLRLSRAALAEVGMGPGPHQRVFGSASGAVITNTEIHMKALRKLSGIEDWSHHTLRHSMVTHLAEAGVPLEVTEALLNHKLGGVAGIYHHAKHEGPKQAALKQWAEMIEAKVVEKHQRA